MLSRQADIILSPLPKYEVRLKVARKVRHRPSSKFLRSVAAISTRRQGSWPYPTICRTLFVVTAVTLNYSHRDRLWVTVDIESISIIVKEYDITVKTLFTA